MSFLAIEGYHVLITGAAGGIGQEALKEFLGRQLTPRAAALKQTRPRRED